jgi:arylformamidase
MLMTDDWPALDTGAPRDLLKGAIAISGLFDLTALVNTTINIKVGLTRDSAAALSPVNLRPATQAPLVLAVGGDESTGFHDQAKALSRAWRPFAAPITLMTLPDRHHLNAFEAIADGDSDLFRATLSLITG